MTLVERIKIAQRGRDQYIFEDLCGLQRDTITDIYNGKMPTPYMILLIARESDVTMKDFLRDVTEPLWDELEEKNKRLA